MSIKFNTYSLDSICKLQMGKTPKRNESAYWGVGFPWVSIADMKGKFIETTKEQITEKAVEDSGSKMIRKGTLLMSFKLSIGKLAFAATDLYTNEAIVALLIRDYNEVYPEYLYYILKTLPLAGRNKAAKGSTLNTASLKKIPVPIPEKYEDQIRIANLLKKTNELIEDRQLSVQQIGEFQTNTFLKMFGNPINNEMGWEKVTLSKLGSLDRGVSKNRPRNSPNLLGGKYPLIQTGEVTNAGLYITEHTHTYSELGLKQSKLWEKGTMLITIAANIARTSILTFDACFPDSIVGFIANKKEANTVYVHFLFGFFQKTLEKNAPQAAQKNINLALLRKLSVPKPSLSLQNKFALTIDKSETLKKDFKRSLLELEQLHSSVSQRVFKGQLDLSKLDITKETESLLELIESAPPIEKEEKQKRRPKSTKVDNLTLTNYYEDEFALLMKNYFGKFHFRFKDIEEMFSEEEGGIITYHTTQELKQMKEKAPKDIQTFIFDCIERKNKNLKLNQIFYNALTDLNLKKIKLKAGNETVLQQINNKQISIEELSGIYFQIAK